MQSRDAGPHSADSLVVETLAQREVELLDENRRLRLEIARLSDGIEALALDWESRRLMTSEALTRLHRVEDELKRTRATNVFLRDEVTKLRNELARFTAAVCRDHGAAA